MTKACDNTPLFAEERKEKILQLLREGSKLLVPELCNFFDVSPATIRNDLRDLEEHGKLKRTHGGAIPINKANFELSTQLKEIKNIDEKKRIANCAASFVENGDTIALDTGTTTFELAKMLCAKSKLTVVTNDIKIAAYLEENSDANIVLIGGVLRRSFHCTTGATAIAQLAGFNVDKAFIAANGLSPEKGFTTPMIEQAEIKKGLIATAAETIFVVDSHKFGLVSFTKFADLSDADRLIIDNGIGKKAVLQMQAANENLEIVIA